jgi:hypothetical protein
MIGRNKCSALREFDSQPLLFDMVVEKCDSIPVADRKIHGSMSET